jgi:hypothetical protein
LLPGKPSASAAAAANKTWPFDEPEPVAVGGRGNCLIDAPESRLEKPPNRQDLGDVGECRGSNGRPGFGELLMELIEVDERAVEVRPWPGHIVHPDADRDQIRTHRQRLGQLIVKDVTYLSAPHAKVGVNQARIVRVDDCGKPIREADDAGRVVTVPEALRLAVTDRDISGVSRHNGRL